MIIWLASYPRSGNTFFRVLMNHVFGTKTYSVYNDLSDIGADKDLAEIVGHEFLPDGFDLERARKSSKLYIIKTHDGPAKIANDKVIYLLRDGRESTLSFQKYLIDYHGEHKPLADMISGKVIFGGWGAHVSAWNPRVRKNALLIQFESLTADPHGHIDDIAKFIGLKPISRNIPSFEDLHKKRPRFFRSGKTNSWKNAYSEYDHYLFWLINHAQMLEFGYTDDMPEFIEKIPGVANLFRIFSDQIRQANSRHEARLQQVERTIGNIEREQARARERIANTVETSIADFNGMCGDSIAGDKRIQVSAIVSTYNSEKYIRGCLEDLEAQTIADKIEIIVVDSGSQQNEHLIVKEFQKRYANIRYIRTEERETIYAAWNRAIAAASGKYLTNANTDDRHVADAYERMVLELEAHTDVALVYADSAVTRQENSGMGEARIDGYFRWPDFDPRHLFSVCYIGPQPMWRKTLHGQYGYFDAQMKVAGDYDFWLRLASREQFRHIPEVLGLYLTSPNSIEHASADACAKETVFAKKRNWPQSWGSMPEPSKGYLIPVGPDVPDARCERDTDEPLVSIIVPTKDRPELLQDTLASVNAQTYENWEVVVVNDGGSDVASLVRELDVHGRYRYIRYPQSRGPSTARNTGIRFSRGEILCYLDDDDTFRPEHLQTVVDALGEHRAEFVYTEAEYIHEEIVNGNRRETDRSMPYSGIEYSRERLHVSNYIPINTWAHRRELLDRAGLFDCELNAFEDWDLLLRFSRLVDFVRIPQPTVEVHMRSGAAGDHLTQRERKDFPALYRKLYERYPVSGAGTEAARKHQLDALDRGKAQSGQVIDGYRKWVAERCITGRDLQHYQQQMLADWTMHPSFHFVMTHVPGQEEALADTLDSLGAQLYGGWGLSVVSNAPCPDPSFAQLDMLEWRQVDGDIMQTVNTVVQESGAQWMMLVEAGTLLQPHFLYTCAETLQQQPGLRLLYTDEDRVDTDGRRYDPLFKPDFNLELMRGIPYPGELLLARCEDLQALGGYATTPGAAASELVFRVAEQAGVGSIGHIADVLVHRQDRFRLATDEQAVADNRRACVAAHLQRVGIDADVQHGTLFGSYFIDYACQQTPPVEIIVNSNGEAGAVELFLGSLRAQTDYPAYRVHLLLREGQRLPENLTGGDDIEIHTCAAGSNVATLAGDIAASSSAKYLLLMSQGCIAIQAHWLSRLVAQAENNDAAVVAPRLISSDRKILASGLILGSGSSGIAGGAFDGLSIDESGYMGRAQVAQELSAVPANCMLVKKAVYEQAGGLSPTFRIPLYQSVDFCLQVRAQGGRIVWTPHATLLYTGDDMKALEVIDLEETVQHESARLCRQALPALANDPAYNPNLKLVGERFAVDTDLVPRWATHDHALKRVIGFGSGSLGSWKYRVEQPLSVIHRERTASSCILPFSATAVRMPTATELERVKPDVLLMHNTIYEGYIDAIEHYKKQNEVFTVFGEDDLIFDLPASNPFSKTVYKDAKKRLRRCLAAADRLLVTTEPLADALGGMAEDIKIVPNYLDEEIWGGLVSRRGVGEKPRVGWAGALQHGGDLELLVEVVRQTADEVDWVFFGMCPTSLRAYVKEFHDPIEFALYPEKLASLNLDLAVAPLAHNRFNECKSNLRLLEYGALGWPVVASNIAPYRNAPVCRVANEPRAWIKAIRERVNDPDAARREGDELRNWVRDNWMLQQHLDEWLAALVPDSDIRQRSGVRHSACRLMAGSP